MGPHVNLATRQTRLFAILPHALHH